MLKAFIRLICHQIMVITLLLLLFSMIFFPFNLPFSAFFLGMAIIPFIVIIFWLIQLGKFQKTVSLREEVADLEDELQCVKDEQATY